jgi:hypothetical protein
MKFSIANILPVKQHIQLLADIDTALLYKSPQYWNAHLPCHSHYRNTEPMINNFLPFTPIHIITYNPIKITLKYQENNGI